MKKLYSLLLGLLLLTGCGLSTNQLQAEQAYYQMLTATSMASGGQNPIVDIKIADPLRPVNIEYIKVYMPRSDKAPTQYTQINYDAPAWQMLGTALTVGLPIYGAYKMVDSLATTMSTMVPSNTYNLSGQSTATVKTAGSSWVGGSVGSGQGGGMWDQTATPTVVMQPAPLVVEPTVVQVPTTQIPTQTITTPAPIVVQVPATP